MPDPNVIRQALRVRLQENARLIREKAKRYPEQSNAEVAKQARGTCSAARRQEVGRACLVA